MLEKVMLSLMLSPMLLGEAVEWLSPSAGREDAGEAELLLPIARGGIVAAQRSGAEREGSAAATPWGRGAGRWRGR